MLGYRFHDIKIFVALFVLNEFMAMPFGIIGTMDKYEIFWAIIGI